MQAVAKPMAAVILGVDVHGEGRQQIGSSDTVRIIFQSLARQQVTVYKQKANQHSFCIAQLFSLAGGLAATLPPSHVL